MPKIKKERINRLLKELGFDDVSVNKPLSKFGLKIFLGNLGLKKEDIQKIIRDNF